jgi:hypothetical protein
MKAAKTLARNKWSDKTEHIWNTWETWGRQCPIVHEKYELKNVF